MTVRLLIVGDVLRALCVLALVSLNFAPGPVATAAGVPSLTDHGVLTAVLDLCGDPVDQGALHAPCHACRASVAILPEAPSCAAIVRAVPAEGPVVVAAAPVAAFRPLPDARGPPLLA